MDRLASPMMGQTENNGLAVLALLPALHFVFNFELLFRMVACASLKTCRRGGRLTGIDVVVLLFGPFR